MQYHIMEIEDHMDTEDEGRDDGKGYPYQSLHSTRGTLLIQKEFEIFLGQ